jgi:hypothetical protein
VREKGLSSTFDVLIFAVLVSTATLLLVEFKPVNQGVEGESYASSLAGSVLLTLQSASVEEVGGVEYELDGLDYLPTTLGGTKRALKHKTFAELLGEDAFLNLRAEVLGERLQLGAIRKFDEKLRGAVKLLLDRVFGGRFGYSLRVRAVLAGLDTSLRGFEVLVEDLEGTGRLLCSKTMILPIPPSKEWPAWGTLGLEVDPFLEMTLEVWSR